MTLPNQEVKSKGGRPSKGVKPLHVTVPTDIADVVRRYAAARKQTISGCITELLISVQPTLETLTAMLEAVEAGPQEAAERMRQSLDKAIKDAAGMKDQLDLLSPKKGGTGGPSM